MDSVLTRRGADVLEMARMELSSSVADAARRSALRCAVFIASPLLWQVSSVGLASEPVPPQQRVDQILTRLQERSDGLSDIRCKVEFVEDDRINLSKRRKLGQILFLITEPNPNFMIRFDRTESDGVLGRREWYLFDGHWLYQAVERTRQVTKQEIVRPPDRINLFDLEKTPFPLPFGQKKKKILKNFDVTLVSPSPSDPPNTDHLVCVPKPDSSMYGKYDKLEFFILRDIHLPCRVVVTKGGGYEIIRADFPDLTAKSLNTGVKRKEFTRPKAWQGYEETVEELPPAP
ncbi:MAG: outer membrane lipoprotein carrier protein LolA [Phycisphaerae bacterium]